ncbi:MAG: ATP-binding protein [Bryobacteraceae bacterium]
MGYLKTLEVNIRLNLEKLLRSVTDVATKLIGAEFGAFCFRCREDQSNALGALSEPDREAFRWSQSPGAAALSGSTLNGGRTVRVNDVLVDERYGLPYFDMPSNDTPARSFLAVPVISKEREVVGGLFFGHSKVGVFTEHHERVAEGVAAEAAMAIENARLFAQVRLQRDHLESVNSDLQHFAYAASHDLQEPLRIVCVFSQLLVRRYGESLDEEAREHLRLIAGAAVSMNDLISGLSEYVSVDRVHPRREPTDMTDVVETAIANLRQPIQETNATVTYSQLPTVHADRHDMIRLLQNLISNAIKYRSADQPYVRVSAEVEKAQLVFSVADNGIGIDPEHHDRVFGVFKRLHARSDVPGAGIGLAICKRVVEKHGGRIWVDSEAGQGSTFRFSIPSGQQDSGSALSSM